MKAEIDGHGKNLPERTLEQSFLILKVGIVILLYGAPPTYKVT